MSCRWRDVISLLALFMMVIFMAGCKAQGVALAKPNRNLASYVVNEFS